MSLKNQTKESMTVFGTGSISAMPDVLTIRLDVVTEHLDLTIAQQFNAEKISRVLQAITERGIPRENIRTVEYTIQPKYDYQNGEQLFTGYEVTHGLLIEIRDINEAGKIIDSAVQLGVNRVGNIQLQIKNPQPIYLQALALAMRDAEKKAQTIAQTLHLTLNPKPISITEITPQQAQPFLALNKTSTQIESGQIIIQATVQLVYTF
ncbi:hypothetical protein HNQ35_002249 [Cerasibacillus quisquiliarum]|uniref:SIMPL domain-containing protein n=1 Tax=Cerasibacillus quisquiliarum TaxID=227865 RepID=A0A511UZ26_9BACI|nr:SIMPL domain-containing protein [Cerasibacillus quisquiliarum]MBB5147032.1 hypothetical protein [Cerasibacillus quisquiliarum]GEN31896.1 hypothetical protein CQU01_21340 [Cerasibacillus quisquiliarum]